MFTAYCATTEHNSTSNQLEFVILITSYNNERWVHENLESACYQKSTNPYTVLYINDCSSDKTGEAAATFVKEKGLENLVTIINNENRIGAMANIYHGIHRYIPKNKIVVSLDGDDLLADNTVLLTLEKYYSDPAIWMTYGSAIKYPNGGRLSNCKKIDEEKLINRELRQTRFTATHLRTFYAGLFMLIDEEHLKYKESFLTTAWDLAMMYPMLEMCAPKKPSEPNHSIFISEVLYKYRLNNPISDFKVHRAKQMSMAKYIRKFTPYEPIDSF